MRRFPPPWTVEKIPGGFKVLVLTSNLSHMSMRARLRADAAKVMARLRQAVDYPLVTPA